MKRNCRNCKKETCNKVDPCKPTCSPCSKQESIAYCGEDVPCMSIKKGDSIHPIIKNIASVVCGVRNDVKAIKKESVPPIEGTYEELFILKSSGELKSGSFYLMTDFQTIYDQPDYDSAGNAKTVVETKTESVDPILLLAISPTEFAKEVWRTSTPRHTLEYDINFQVTEYMGAPAKGRITSCKDEFDNETTYDHTVVLLKRYESVSGSGVFDSYKDTGFASTEVLTFGSNAFDNKIEKSGIELGIGDFIVGNNTFGEDPQANRFIQRTRNNTFGDGAKRNTFEGVASNNTFGRNTDGNTFSKTTSTNIFGDFTDNNIFGNHTQKNIFGNHTQDNTFGGQVTNNTFGGQVFNNTFGNSILNSTFGDMFKGNRIKNTVNIVDFSAATHVYSDYPCTIFETPNGTLKLSYIDNAGVLQVVNPTA